MFNLQIFFHLLLITIYKHMVIYCNIMQLDVNRNLPLMNRAPLMHVCDPFNDLKICNVWYVYMNINQTFAACNSCYVVHISVEFFDDVVQGKFMKSVMLSFI